MPKPLVPAGGGFSAIRYSLRKGSEAGGAFKLYRRLRSKNVCKTCAVGMGGQRGGMVNEAGHFPEVCKKSFQVQAADMQRPIPESFFQDYSVAELERWSSMELDLAGRLAFPVAWSEGETHFRRIDWEQALDRLAAELTASPPESAFFYASGRSSNEAAFCMQSLARAHGTNNVNSCDSYCHSASAVALTRMLGTDSSTVALDDLDRTEVAVVAGANPASNHPRLMAKLVELRRRGGKVLVINPIKELGFVRYRVPSRPGGLFFGTEVADVYLQPNAGSDTALFKALLKGLLERREVDRIFLRNHVEGWEAVESDVTASDWGELILACGVARAEIDAAIEMIGAAATGIILWSTGLTHHEGGTNNVLALGNLAAALGWIGRSGCGLVPLRGHSNSQGVASVGMKPELGPTFARNMRELHGSPATRGLDTYECLEAAHEGRMRTAVLLGGNLWGATPDQTWSSEAMRNIDTVAHVATKLNAGHVHGRGRLNLILPVLARDEESQPTTQESLFGLVRLSDGGHPGPDGELKSEVELICALAARLVPSSPFPFDRLTNHHAIREAMARVVPGYAAIGEIDGSGQEFQIQEKILHDPRFNTPDGKFRAHVTPLARFGPADGDFRLMTLRSEGQFNTVVYEEEDVYRGNRRRDVVMMNRSDAEGMDLGEGDPVKVVSEVGLLEVVVTYADLPPANVAMYFPEANVLVPRRVDPDSGTPAFKSVAVRIVK